MDIMTQYTLKLWEVSAVFGVMALWIIYLIYEKHKVDQRNQDLVAALTDLSNTITKSFTGISHLNNRLISKVETQISKLRELIISSIK